MKFTAQVDRKVKYLKLHRQMISALTAVTLPILAVLDKIWMLYIDSVCSTLRVISAEQ